jgi:hypothetical protein
MTELTTTAFAAAFRRVIEVYGLTVSALQRRLAAQQYDVSVNHLSDILAGQRRPSPELINAICRVLKLPAMDKETLHRAAARDKGFSI